MFNKKIKKETLSELKDRVDNYQNEYKSSLGEIVGFHKKRLSHVDSIIEVEKLVNSLANTPKEFKKISGEISINRIDFENNIENIEIENRKNEAIDGGIKIGGVATGVGVAAFGPTAAIAIATTFGTASTGTAIATLSGAAATNAAMAWLGGGALAVGGGGMVAGEAFLALAGPVGWAIGAAAFAGGGVLDSNKNKKIAKKAEIEIIQVKEETTKLKAIKHKVNKLMIESVELSNKVKYQLNKVNNYDTKDFMDLSEEQQREIMILLNTTLSLSEKISEEVDK